MVQRVSLDKCLKSGGSGGGMIEKYASAVVRETLRKYRSRMIFSELPISSASKPKLLTTLNR